MVPATLSLSYHTTCRCVAVPPATILQGLDCFHTKINVWSGWGGEADAGFMAAQHCCWVRIEKKSGKPKQDNAQISTTPTINSTSLGSGKATAHSQLIADTTLWEATTIELENINTSKLSKHISSSASPGFQVMPSPKFFFVH